MQYIGNYKKKLSLIESIKNLIFTSKIYAISSFFLLLIILTGCTSNILKLDRNDSNSLFLFDDNNIFPDQASGFYPEGIMMDSRAFKKMYVGMGKDRVRSLLGDRQFKATSYSVWHQWDYVFKLINKYGVLQECQYQIHFYGGMAYQGFWRTPECLSLAQEHYSAIAPEVISAAADEASTPEVASRKIYFLSTDILFGTKKGDISALSEGNKKELDKLILIIKDKINSIKNINISGYTDALNNDISIRELAITRARVVREYMVEKGIPAAKVVSVNPIYSNHVSIAPGDENANLMQCLCSGHLIEILINFNEGKF